MPRWAIVTVGSPHSVRPDIPRRGRNHSAPDDKPIAEINVDDDLRATFDLSELFECGL
ncbi:hypothetical protein ALC57_14355 [Trachymyrmex cornetzi]|uniref:Uncharacterized protein n=1 Tax=Trachymyrmex cornetzi TaxID=471704 RepID=A0A195DKH7_9HYME|nr:hypothetical protein ALC57_14355 [Trachymyrmex cornetzi]